MRLPKLFLVQRTIERDIAIPEFFKNAGWR